MTTRPPCKVGDRIKLIHMPEDPCPIPAGTTGTVKGITDLFGHQTPEFQIWIDWDIKRNLSLIWPIDTFEVIDTLQHNHKE